MNNDHQHLQAWYNRKANVGTNESFYALGETAKHFGDAVSRGLDMVAHLTCTDIADWQFWTIAERFDPGYILAFERPWDKDTKAGEPAVALFAITNDGEFIVYPNSIQIANYVNDWNPETGCDVAW